MSNPIIIETDLKDILAKLDNRLERIETKLEVLPKIEAEVSQLKEDVRNLKGIETKLEVLPKIETEVSQIKEDVKDLKETATAQIWALIVTVIGATVAAMIKFGFLTKT
jgi:predicted nuclease with TOPRIM domain